MVCIAAQNVNFHLEDDYLPMDGMGYTSFRQNNLSGFGLGFTMDLPLDVFVLVDIWCFLHFLPHKVRTNQVSLHQV